MPFLDEPLVQPFERPNEHPQMHLAFAELANPLPVPLLDSWIGEQGGRLHPQRVDPNPTSISTRIDQPRVDLPPFPIEISPI